MNQRSKIAIVGYGIEGKAMLAYLMKHKFVNVTVCDQNVSLRDRMPDGVSVRLGKDYLEGIRDFDVIFRSPGVNHDNPFLVEAKVLGKVVTSPTQYFLDQCPCTVVGVTGTKGKGTTSTLIYEILKEGLGGKGGNRAKKRAVFLGGNIGNAPIEFLDKVKKNSVVVLELSCFQLGDLNKSPSIAVLLNTTSDHLDYYPDVDTYLRAKELILAHQNRGDLAVLNVDYEYSRYYKPLVKGGLRLVSPKGFFVKNGAYVEKGWILYARGGETEKVMRVSDVALIGSHNIENVCPAVVVAKELGVSSAVVARIVKKFKGLEHRLEFVRKVDGVSYYDDSFSTNPQTSMAAVDSFDVPTILIAGGSDKGLSYDDWARKILTKASLEVVLLIGDLSGKMEKAIESAKKRLGSGEATPTKIISCGDLKNALLVARKEAVRGGVVVMSPAAASFDQFKDYKERGKKFKEWVVEM